MPEDSLDLPLRNCNMLLPTLHYHNKVRDHFKQHPAIWGEFAGGGARAEQLAALKTELLKDTTTLEPGSSPLIFDRIAVAKEKLGLGALPVKAYQKLNTDHDDLHTDGHDPHAGNHTLDAAGQTLNPGDHDLSARVIYLHQDAHLIFSGNPEQGLDEEELLALIAHELTRVKLYTLPDEELEVADHIIAAIANQYDREPSLSPYSSLSPYYETARRWGIYTEIYCDRGASTVLEDPTPVINMLSKVTTRPSGIRSAALHQGESLVRSRALSLWHEHREAAEPAIIQLIEGAPELDRLDIFAQKELAELTREFLQCYLSPAWFHSTKVKDLAGQYFREGSVEQEAGSPPERSGSSPQQATLRLPSLRQPGSPGAPDVGPIITSIADAHDSVKEYFSYLLLDFALVDPSLQEAPAGRAFQFAEEMQLADPYASIVKKELQLSDKKVQQYMQQALTACGAAGPNHYPNQ
jgi:hypothetical protein